MAIALQDDIGVGDSQEQLRQTVASDGMSPIHQYVAVGDADVAYEVVGEGPQDLLYFYGPGSHIDLYWESPEIARFLSRLASCNRLIMFDRRETGATR